MILDFRNKRTQRFAAGKRVSDFESFRYQADKCLVFLEAAITLDDLRGLRSKRLEALKGERKGSYSLHIDQQWRICFEWPHGENGPLKVEIVDFFRTKSSWAAH